MIISAGGVVVKDRKVLLLHTTNGRWVLPKGHVERDESLREAALREVREESGVTAKIERKLGWVNYEFRSGGRFFKKKVIWFLMRAMDGEPHPQQEEGFVDACYKQLDELDSLNMYENEVKIIRMALC